MSQPLQTPPATNREQRFRNEIQWNNDLDPSDAEDNSDNQDEQRRQLTEPFDISNEAPGMTAVEHPNQDLALRAALLSTALDGTHDDFETQPIYKRSLKTMQRMFEARKGGKSMANPIRRTRMQWRHTELTVPSSNPDIHWNADEFYLDLLICRGRDIVLSAVLPNLEIHHGIEFKLELSMSLRTFSAKFAHLDFDPVGAV